MAYDSPGAGGVRGRGLLGRGQWERVVLLLGIADWRATVAEATRAVTLEAPIKLFNPALDWGARFVV